MLVLLSLLSEGVPLLIVTPHSHSHLHELLVLLVPSSDVPVPSFLPQLVLLLLLVARTYHDKLLIPPSLHEDVLVLLPSKDSRSTLYARSTRVCSFLVTTINAYPYHILLSSQFLAMSFIHLIHPTVSHLG